MDKINDTTTLITETIITVIKTVVSSIKLANSKLANVTIGAKIKMN